jgi:hypothetical protein
LQLPLYYRKQSPPDPPPRQSPIHHIMPASSSVASTPMVRKSGYHLTDDPKINYDADAGILCIASGTAFQHDANGELVCTEGKYSSRFPNSNAITHVLKEILGSFTEGEWERVKVNDPEQLSRVSAAIVDTYDRNQDVSFPPSYTNLRASRTKVLLKYENVPRVAHYRLPDTQSSTAPNPKPSSLKPSRMLPSVRIPDTYDNQSLHIIGPFDITIDGTVVPKEIQELCALSGRSVNAFSKIIAQSLPLIGEDLAALGASKADGRNIFLRNKQHIEKKLRSSVRSAGKQWSNSFVDLDHIDHKRVEGSDSEYRATPVFTRRFAGLEPIEVQVVADYSRITNGDSRATTERGSVG